MTAARRRREKPHQPVGPIVLGLLGMGVLLFGYVWWPIQAERHLVMLKKVDVQMAQVKSEIAVLQDRYQSMISLAALDEWAKTHGPWEPLEDSNVVPIEQN